MQLPFQKTGISLLCAREKTVKEFFAVFLSVEDKKKPAVLQF
jgi:hypothetical protein